MKLFDDPFDKSANLLPMDGEVYYFGKVFTPMEADRYFKEMMKHIAWQNDEAVIFGKLIKTKRKVAWYGNRPFDYTYSNLTKKALPWNRLLLDLKAKVEDETNNLFNSCLLNLYHDGEEGMGWHSDAEKNLENNGAIASVSFGAERKFAFKHKKTKEKIEVRLEHGSLLIMTGKTQKYWLHRLPPTKKVLLPRINLTFRTIVD